MSVLRSVFERRSLTVDTPGKWRQGMVWQPWPGATPVSTDQAMRLSAVWACLRILTDAVATLPLGTFRRVEGTRIEFPLPEYLRFVDPRQDSRVDYLTQVMLSMLTDGNAFVATQRDSMGVPTRLVPLDPGRVTVRHATGSADSEIVYEVDGQVVDRWAVMHIAGMRLPGSLRGLSPIAYARETVGLGLAAQRFGTAFFENGALPGAVIETDGTMSDDAIKRFRETWYDRHGGIANAQRVGVLTGGAKISKISIQPNDAQFLETRQFQVPDVARIFGVPPHLIADASNSTSWGSGLAEQNLAFGQFSLRPWIERIESAHTRLLSTHGPRDVFAKLNLDALLRASLKDRYEAYKLGVDGGWLDVEQDIRPTEDLPPLDHPRPAPPPDPSPGGAE